MATGHAEHAEWQQCHFRLVTVLLAITYSAWHRFDTPMVHVAVTAIVGAGIWYVVAGRDLGKACVRIVIAMFYDCMVVSWAMLILGTSGMGLYCIFLWISIGYPIRYRRPFYALLGSVSTLLCFSVVAVATGLSRNHPDLFVGVAASLVFAPLRVAQLLKRLIASEEIKDEFIANVSHDLLTPINSIMGFSERMRKVCAREQREGAEHIYASARLLASMIRSLIDATSSAGEEKKTDFSVQEVVRMVICSNNESAREKGIQICPEVDIGFALYGAENVVISCLLNLVNNAVKYSERGTIRIAAWYEVAHGTLHFSVSDEGMGIEEALQERIFDRFYRSPSTSGIPGLGIGLTGVRKSLEAVGGDVRLTSGGKGSVFSFSLPADISRKKQVRECDDIRLAESCVMLVDDDPLSCRAWSGNLHDAGYRVIAVNSAFEALKIVEDPAGLHIDAFVLDYRMPGMSGAELALRIKSRRQVPVILISADPPLLFHRLVQERRVDAVLQKPFSSGSLVAQIERELGMAASRRSIPDRLKVELRELYLADLRSYMAQLRDNAPQELVDAIFHKLGSAAAIVGDRGILAGLNRPRMRVISRDMLLQIMLGSELLVRETGPAIKD